MMHDRGPDDGGGMGVITFIVCVLIGMCFLYYAGVLLR